jgi:sugar phosphate isomerase/epimerase
MSTSSKPWSRRKALKAIGLLVLVCPPLIPANAAPRKRGIALQLYTLRDQAKKDLTDTLKKVREMGWEYVQWSGMPKLPAEKIRAELDAAGLKAIAAHTGMEPFEKNFDSKVEFWKTVGIKDIAPGSMMEDCKSDLKAWLEGARRLDALGAKFRAAGLRLSYHNHDFELKKFPGDERRKLDILMESTSAQNLCAEFDLAWLRVGGVDPAAYIRKYKGRCPVVHAKDVVRASKGKPMQFKPLGQGELSWPEIFAAGDEAGIEWYIYEQDSGEGSPFDYARASYEFLSKHVK